MRRLIMSRLIWIYAGRHSVFHLYIQTSSQSIVSLNQKQTTKAVWNLAAKELKYNAVLIYPPTLNLIKLTPRYFFYKAKYFGNILYGFSLQYKTNVYSMSPTVPDFLLRLSICRNSRTTGTNPHQSVPSVTSQHVASSQTGTSVEMYRII